MGRFIEMNNYDIDEEAKLLEDTYSSYSLARMYLAKCLEVEKLMEEREGVSTT
jgi:hypothetical protein